MPCSACSLLPPLFAALLLAALPPLPAQPTASVPPPPPPLQSLCNTTANASLCLSTLCSYPSSQPSALLPDLTAFVASSALAQLNSSYSIARGIAQEDADSGGGDEESSWPTLQDCLELMADSQGGLQSSVRLLSHLGARDPPGSLSEQLMDVRVWLSASLTDMDTCWDELADPAAAALRARLKQAGQSRIEPLLSMAMAMAQKLQQTAGVNMTYALTCRHHHYHASPAPLVQ